jgi:hypothetical protein
LSAFALLVIGNAALCASCQDAYPIAATECDEWCDASHLLACGSYNPADCVALCEQQRLSRADCRGYFETALDCLHGTPNSELECASWLYTKPAPCNDDLTQLYDCADLFDSNGVGGAPPTRL